MLIVCDNSHEMSSYFFEKKKKIQKEIKMSSAATGISTVRVKETT